MLQPVRPPPALTGRRRHHAHRVPGSRPQPACVQLQAAPRAQQVMADQEYRSGAQVIVLDFDGVLVDSEGEVTHSGFMAARQRWPDVLAGTPADTIEAALARMRHVRPVIVRGFESLVMFRLLMEDASDRQVNRMLADWSSVLADWLARNNETPEVLTQCHEQYRNGLMKTARQQWLSLQKPYPGVVEALRSTPFPWYLATSKAAHRVSELITHAMHYPMEATNPRLYASLLPPEPAKAQALRDITALHTTMPTQPELKVASVSSQYVPGSPVEHQAELPPLAQRAGDQQQQQELPIVHFVDDRLETLKAIAEAPGLSHVRLYMADWGYNTAAEREEAAELQDKITLIDLTQFSSLMLTGQLTSSN